MCTIFGVIGRQDAGEFKSAFSCVAKRGRYIQFFSHRGEQYAYSRLPTDGSDTNTNSISSRKPYLFLNGIVHNVDDLHSLFRLTASTKESDVQTVREGLKRYGTKFLSRCRGMFAYAYITQHEVQLGRDTLGIKPLFYAVDTNRFAFSSELKGLAALGFTQIKEVSPGGIILYSKKTHRIHRERFAYKGYVVTTTIKNLLNSSVVLPTQRYIRQFQNKKIGILVSGGLDSSILFALLAQGLTLEEFERIIPVCVGSSSGTDKMYAKRLGKAYDKHIHILDIPSRRQCIKQLQKFVYMVESPYARAVKVACIQDVAARFFSKNNIDVVISGEGADEIFFGYPRLIEGIHQDRVRDVYRFFLKHVFPKTLLQRLDRIFSVHTIEARVPFLDQELVLLAQKIPISQKFMFDSDVLITKAPLRQFAKDIGLPDFLINRPKISMTLGATGLENTESSDGYLEDFETERSAIADLVQGYYNKIFGKTTYGAHEIAHDLRLKELEMIKSLKQKNRLVDTNI